MNQSTATRYFVFPALIGLGLSIWLTVIHYYAHTNPAYEPVCSVGRTVNCVSVAASQYSVFLGLPLSIIGMGYYLLVFLLGLGHLRKSAASTPFVILSVASVVGVAAGLYLAFVSYAVIQAVCLACTGTYLLNFLILYGVHCQARGNGGWVRSFRTGLSSIMAEKWPAVFTLILLLVFIIAGPGGAFPRYYESATWRTGLDIASGIDRDGHPWLGAKEPKVVVHEYFDFECPACKLSHRKLRHYIEKFADRVRLVRHDTSRVSCSFSDGKPNPALCRSARVAYCALLEGRYWEWNDATVAHPKSLSPMSTVKYEMTLAKRLGFEDEALSKCMSANKTHAYVQDNYEDAKKFGVRSTPSYFVDGKPLTLAQVVKLIVRKN